MSDIKLLAVIVFLLSYLSIVVFYHKKSTVVWIAVMAVILTGILSPSHAIGSINWNVILLYLGMMFVSGIFVYSKMPDYLASLFVSKTRTAAASMVVICAFAGAISIFLDNVTVVLLVAPVALSIARKCGINPVPLFVGMAVSANLQGCATLIGDPPSMLLAGFAKMDFNDFFVINGRPGIFFAIQAGAMVSLAVLYILFRMHDKRTPELKGENYLSVVPSLLVAMLVISMIAASSLNHGITYINGVLCILFGMFCFIWYLSKVGWKEAKSFMINRDWQTIFFLAGVFILVESLSASGILEDLATLILNIGHGNPLLLFLLVVWGSVLISGFVDNIPFLIAMLPVVQTITQSLGANPYLFYFGLLIGVSVGGNITPIGASANIAAMGIMKKEGYSVKFMDFVKIGLPFTIASVAVSSLFLWLVFG